MNKIISISIKDDETEDGQPGTTVKVVGNGKISKYATKSMDFPPRIVVDLFADAKSFETTEIPAKSQKLKKVKIGHHPKSIRLVLELKTTDIPPFKTRVTGNALTIFLGSQDRMIKPERVLIDVIRSRGNDDMFSRETKSPEDHEPQSAEAVLSQTDNGWFLSIKCPFPSSK